MATVALSSSSSSRDEAKLETSPDRSEQADSSAEKASVLEVLKKVRDEILGTSHFLFAASSNVQTVLFLYVSDLGDGVLRDVCVHRHAVRIPRRHCRCPNSIPKWKMG